MPPSTNTLDGIQSTRESSSMMVLEERLIERINSYIFRSHHSSNTVDVKDARSEGRDFPFNEIRVYQRSDYPPDPLTEINPDFKGFFPVNPLTWATKSFQNFALGEVVRAFRILRGGFVREHRVVNYENIMCSVSQEDVVYVD
jgi:hypothetical protein